MPYFVGSINATFVLMKERKNLQLIWLRKMCIQKNIIKIGLNPVKTLNQVKNQSYKCVSSCYVFVALI